VVFVLTVETTLKCLSSHCCFGWAIRTKPILIAPRAAMPEKHTTMLATNQTGVVQRNALTISAS
jgi:hypothetical protein